MTPALAAGAAAQPPGHPSLLGTGRGRAGFGDPAGFPNFSSDGPIHGPDRSEPLGCDSARGWSDSAVRGAYGWGAGVTHPATARGIGTRSLKGIVTSAPHALGVLDEAEAFRFEDHLVECPTVHGAGDRIRPRHPPVDAGNWRATPPVDCSCCPGDHAPEGRPQAECCTPWPPPWGRAPWPVPASSSTRDRPTRRCGSPRPTSGRGMGAGHHRGRGLGHRCESRSRTGRGPRSAAWSPSDSTARSRRSRVGTSPGRRPAEHHARRGRLHPDQIARYEVRTRAGTGNIW